MMKKKFVICGVFGAMLLSGNVLAACPSNLSAEDMYDCIVVEGAGGVYDVPSNYKSDTVSQNQSDKDSSKLASAAK